MNLLKRIYQLAVGYWEMLDTAEKLGIVLAISGLSLVIAVLS